MHALCFVLSMLSLQAVVSALPGLCEWQRDTMGKEGELAAIMSSGFGVVPELQDFDGRSLRSFSEARRDALRSYRESLDEAQMQMIVSKTSDALASEPPRWKVVWLGLAVAYLAPPDHRLLDMAQAIIEAPPTIAGNAELIEELAKAATWLLVSSGEAQRIEAVLRVLLSPKHTSDAEAKHRLESVAEAAIRSITNLPTVEARKYLELLKDQHPFPALGEGSETVSADITAQLLQQALEFVVAVESGNGMVNMGGIRR